LGVTWVSAQTLQAVVTAYAVASGGFLLLGGRTADLLGRRRVLVTGLALYAASALAGGLAQGQQMLLGARAVQGLSGALVFSTTLALVNVTFPEGRARNRALGVWGGAGAAGLVVGVLLGGILTRAVGWQAVRQSSGFDAEQRQAGGLAAHQRFLLAGFCNIKVDAEFFVVRQAHQQPTVVAHRGILGDLEAQLFGIELERLALIADE
jgi:MFS family permease